MNLKERVIYAPGANECELLRSFSKKGLNTFGLRIMGTKDLISFVLEKNGLSFNETFITKNLSSLIIYNVLKKEKYFSNIKLHDAFEFVDSLNEFESTIVDIDSYSLLKEGYFKEKNEAILKTFEIYKKFLNKNNLIDEHFLLRKVLNTELCVNFDIFTLSEFPLKNNEKTLLRKLIGKEENQFTTILSNEFKIKEYNGFYGEKAEAEYVFKYIIENKIKFDECVVAVSNGKYRTIFEDIALINNLPISFGIGKTVIESNPGKLLNEIICWINNFYYKDNLFSILNSQFIDRDLLSKDLDIDKKYLKKIAETGGNLRLSLNSKQNYQSCENYKRAIEEGTISFKTDYLKNEELKKVKACIKLSNILNEGVSGILKYSKISKIYKTEDQSALESIINFIDAGLSLDIPLDEILNKAISISVSSKVSSEGSLYVTSISKAKSVIRKYLFVVGLSNDLYPGAAKDNCLFLDSDYKLFDENLEKSKQELSNKKDELISLLRLNCNNEIFISYPYYSCEDLKTKNPSSMIFEIFKSTNEGDSTLEDLVGGENKEGIIVKHNFFECSISNGRNIGKEYATNSNIISDFKTNIIPQKNDLNKLLNKSFSASQIDNFFRCPYRFYLETIIGFEDEFIVDPTESLDAASYGNILHESLENLNKNTQSKEDYLHIIEDLYKKYKISHPILSDELEEKDLLRLKDAGENAYKMASNNKLLVSEDDIKNIHVKSGISIHGFPDRAEIDNNGEVIVIDYKTKSHFDHDIDDPKTFGQILTYAYLVKLKYNRKISKVEYRYLKQGKSIYVEGKKLESFFDYFDEQLLKLKNCIEIGKFEKCIDCKDKYCPYYDLCLSSISMEDDSNE